MSKLSSHKISRRRLMLAGAGTATAAVAVAALTPANSEPTPEANSKADAREPGGGYQVTEHVLTYYRTARV